MNAKPIQKPSVMPSVNPCGTSRLNIRQDKTRQDNKAGFGSQNQNQNPPNLLAGQPYERVCFSWFFSLRFASAERHLVSSETFSTSYQQSFPQSSKEDEGCGTKTSSRSSAVRSAERNGLPIGSVQSSGPTCGTRRLARSSASSAIGSTSGAGGVASFAGNEGFERLPLRRRCDEAPRRARRPRGALRRARDVRGVLVGVAAARSDSAPARHRGDIGAVVTTGAGR